MQLSDAIRRAQREIVEDIEAGILPKTVASWSDLDHHVDANTYGGACDESGPFEVFFWGIDETGETCLNIEVVNAMTDAVDAWLKSGSHLATLKVTA